MSTTIEHTEPGQREHPPHLAHHFDTPSQQFEASVQGMWLFLATEILLFAGLFCAYAVYRATHPEIFIEGHHHLSVKWGAVNTIILLCSSFTIATAVWAVQHDRQKLLAWMLGLTIAGGLGFMGIKYVEYKEKWQHGLLWGTRYQPQPHGDHHAAAHAETAPASAESRSDAAPPAGDEPAAADEQSAGNEQADAAPDAIRRAFEPPSLGPAGLARPEPAEVSPRQRVRNVQTFFAVYFIMTGLHGLHVIAGIAAIGWLLARALLGHFSAAYFTPVPMVGLYWHVVDLVWIYLFPLLYLIH